MKKLTAIASAALFASVLSVEAATIVPASGFDLSVNGTQNSDVQVFSEGSNVSVADGAVTLDYLVGTNLNIGDTKPGVNGFSSGQSLAAGNYNSFLVHFDPLGDGDFQGVVDFGLKIVGLIVSNGRDATKLLNESDAIFGTADSYASNLGRRTEFHDRFTLASASSLSLNLFTNSNNVDNIRVITEVAAVPVPASLSLMLAGLGGLMVARRRRRS